MDDEIEDDDFDDEEDNQSKDRAKQQEGTKNPEMEALKKQLKQTASRRIGN